MLKCIMEPGETIYYPNVHDPIGRPMTVKYNYVGLSKNKKVFVQYLTDDLIDCMVADMHENLNQEFDNVVGVFGGEGSGKSNLAYHICKKFDPDFDVVNGYVYDVQTFINKLHEDQLKGTVYWMDEATNLVGNRNWMKEENKILIDILKLMRSRGMTIVMCNPDFGGVDVYLREKRLRYTCTVKMRGWDQDPVKKRGYFEMAKRDDNSDDLRTICWGTFPKIPPEEKAIYESIKQNRQIEKVNKYKEDMDAQQEGGGRLAKATEYNRRMALALKENTGMTYDEIALETGIPAGTIKRLANEGKKQEGI